MPRALHDAALLFGYFVICRPYVERPLVGLCRAILRGVMKVLQMDGSI